MKDEKIWDKVLRTLYSVRYLRYNWWLDNLMNGLIND